MLLFKNSTLLAFGLLLTLASCGGGGGDDGGADVDAVDDSVPPPVVKTFKTFQSADAVIGQPDFTSGLANQGGSPGANTLNQAVGAPAAGNFYVLDPSNSRILGFNTIPATNNASAQRLLDLGEKSVILPTRTLSICDFAFVSFLSHHFMQCFPIQKIGIIMKLLCLPNYSFKGNFIAVLILYLFSSYASAVTVCTPAVGVCDYEEIQTAINNAVDGDIIEISAEIFSEGITIDKDLTLIGEGEADTSIMYGGGSVVTVLPNATVYIQDLAITNGIADQGGGVHNSGDLTMYQVTVASNFAFSQGGCVYR